MRWETQTEIIRMPATTGRIGFDQRWLRLDQSNASNRGTSSSSAAPGAHAPGLSY